MGRGRTPMEGCGAALLVRRFVERRRRRQSTAALATANGCSGDAASARGGSSDSCWARLMPVMDGGVDRLVRSSGLLLATVGVVGTLWCIGLHFVAVLPHFVGHRPLESLAGVCHLAFSVFLAHGGFYNYYKCMYTPPGSPSLSEAHERQLTKLLFNRRSAGLKEIKHNAWCRKCEKPKPRRAHHCSICKKCILGMDHHCPWVWNCVGQNNQKYFFLFLVYSWMGSFYGLVMMSFPFAELFIYKPWEINASREAIFFSWIVILFGNCATAAMVVFQGYIISKGKTTLEFYQIRRIAKKGVVAEQEYFNEYDHGLRKNWEIFFERRGWPVWWLFSWLPPPQADYIPPPPPDYGVPASLIEEGAAEGSPY